MDPVTGTRLRQQAPLFAAVAIVALFLALDVSVFHPLAARYETALATARALGMSADPSRAPALAPLPPRVFALVMDNSLPAAEADARAQSGALTADMVQAVSALAARRGLEVLLAEPGLLTTQPGSIEMRAHLRLRGDYTGFVALLDDLAEGGKLWNVERFTVVPLDGHREDIELWISSCVLKRTRGGS